MAIVNFICVMILILCLLGIIRNNYTYTRITEGNDLVFKYIKTLHGKNYDWDKDYFKEMVIRYDKYFVSLKLWGKNSAIKSEYKDKLLKIINELEKMK